MSKINIKLLGDRVLVEPIDTSTEKTKFGIIIPDTVSKEKSEQGKIIVVGEGKRNEEGKLVPMSVKKGQKIVFSKYGPDEIKIDGKEYFIISESNILAVIE